MMKKTETPWTQAKLTNGSIVMPLVTLVDGYGGVSHIIRDDNCFVLINRVGESNNEPNGTFAISPYWFKEAAAALVGYITGDWNLAFQPQEEEKS